MTTYDHREQAFEAEFTHDAEMRFRAHARRDRKLGLWAAALIGKTGEAAHDYAAGIVALGLETSPDTAIKARLMADFGKNGVVQSESQITQTMLALLKDAEQEIKLEASF